MKYLLIVLTTFILFSCSKEEIIPGVEPPKTFLASFNLGDVHISSGSQMKASIESGDIVLMKIFKGEEFMYFGAWTGTITPIELTHGQQYTFEVSVVKDYQSLYVPGKDFFFLQNTDNSAYFWRTASHNKWMSGDYISKADPFGRFSTTFPSQSGYHRGYEVFASIETKTADYNNPTISLKPRRYNTKLNLSTYNLRNLTQGSVRARILQRTTRNGANIQDFYYLDHIFKYPNNYHQYVITPINLRKTINGEHETCEIRLENHYGTTKDVIISPDGTGYWDIDNTFSGVYDFCCDDLEQARYTLTLEPSIVDCYECDNASGQVRTKVPEIGTDYLASVNVHFNEYFCFIGKNGYVVKSVDVPARGSTNVGIAIANQPWINGKRAKIYRITMKEMFDNYFDLDFMKYKIVLEHETTKEQKTIYKYLRFGRN